MWLAAQPELVWESLASASTSSVRSEPLIIQPVMRRLNTSSTIAR
jgi:hypothetical protein